MSNYPRHAVPLIYQTGAGRDCRTAIEKRIHIPALGLKFLWHGDEDDFAFINRGEVERACLVQNTSATSGVRKYCR